jgi:hypothetical protein
MSGEFRRIFGYALEFYLRRVAIVALFSIPFLIAVLIATLVAAPTFLAAGGLFIRTGSIPELSIFDIILTILGYAIAVFIISNTIVNINILVRSRRTMTETTSEMVSAMGKHGTRIFYIITLVLLIQFILQLTLYDNVYKSWIYPAVLGVLWFFLSFSFPAVVIDNARTADAIACSFSFATRKPLLVLKWMLAGFILILFSYGLAFLTLSPPYSAYLILLLNSIVFLPFLLILQTQIYMEKYPLAR